MITLYRISLSILLVMVLGCFTSPTQESDPMTFPVRLETVHDYPNYTFASDLDGDGRDEIIWIQNSMDRYGAGRHLGYVRLDALDGKVIEQVNYPGLIAAQSLHFLDYDHDGVKELLVPYVVHDSLFVSFVNASGRKLFSFFLMNGQPRKEVDGEIAWDPNIFYVQVADINRDGKEDLITLVATGYARLPRGIFIHTLPEGKLLGKTIVGAGFYLGGGYFDDFNGDKSLDFVTATFASNNGAIAGGFDDQHAYLINFGLTPSPLVTWSKTMAERWNRSTLHYLDFDGDGKKELLCFTSGAAPIQKAQLELIEPGTWQTKRQRVFNEPFTMAAVLDLNRDLRPEIIVSSAANEFLMLNAQFEIIKRQKNMPMAYVLRTLPDLDDDGIEEVFMAGAKHGFWLTPELEIKTIIPSFDYINVVQTGIGKQPYVLTTLRDRSNAKVYSKLLRQQENRFHLWYRYGPTTMGIIGGLAVLGFALSFFVMLRSHRRETALQESVFDSGTRGLMFLQPDGRILRCNHHLFSCLQQTEPKSLKDRHFTEVLNHDELLAFLRAALQAPYHRHETKITCPPEQTERVVHVIVDPLTIKGHSRPHWLVQFLDKTVELEIHQARIWGKMAQRIAHDIKNLLTPILLTQQRLQMEYRERSPEAAAVYDGYTSKITERIEALRLMTRNFMKLINLEKLHLTETELHPFLHSAVQHLNKNLPPDVVLDLKLNGHDETASIDQDQIKVLLENLVSNAINAMPEGGKITVTTDFAKGLHLVAAAPEPHDYAVIEISDTGKGMPRDMLDKIFEPDFTATENGTGLGLAIVKKIVEGHHGHIEVESDPGMGTVFSVYLPVR